MNLLYDIKLSDGKEIYGCYFVLYQTYIYAKKDNIKLIKCLSQETLKCFDKNNIEITDRDFDDMTLLKAYDENNNECDYLKYILSVARNSIDTGNWLARRIECIDIN